MRSLPLLLAALAVACGGGGSDRPAAVTPISPTPPTPPAVSTTARLVSVLEASQTIAGATIESDQLGSATSNAQDYFTLQATASSTYPIRVGAASWVERVTRIRVPGDEATVTLIPNTLNMTYFDEMCRYGGGQIMRWSSAPALVVESSVLTYGSRVSTGETIPAAVVDRTLGEVRSGLALLSAGVFGDYVSIERRQTPAGEMSTVPAGAIALTWQRGLLTGFGHVAYGARRPGGADGSLVGGEVALDYEWHAYGLPAGSRRDFFNVVQHELGHTLGYSHTKIAPSFMYEVFLMTVSAQDREAFAVFMQRQNGNRAPDTDPVTISVNLTAPLGEFLIPRCAFLAR